MHFCIHRNDDRDIKLIARLRRPAVEIFECMLTNPDGVMPSLEITLGSTQVQLAPVSINAWITTTAGTSSPAFFMAAARGPLTLIPTVTMAPRGSRLIFSDGVTQIARDELNLLDGANLLHQKWVHAKLLIPSR